MIIHGVNDSRGQYSGPWGEPSAMPIGKISSTHQKKNNHTENEKKGWQQKMTDGKCKKKMLKYDLQSFRIYTKCTT